jgi:hypothetical protein
VQATFYPSLQKLIFTPTGARFLGDLAFVNPDDPTSELFAARSSFSWKYLESTEEQVLSLFQRVSVTTDSLAMLGWTFFALVGTPVVVLCPLVPASHSLTV